jgi:ferredoxin
VIPGIEKSQFHFKVPDRDDFGNMLVDLMLACAPDLSIMDAVVGMEGEGPAGGTPKKIGALIASADSVALDVVASAIAGFDPMEVYTNKAAATRGIGPRSVDDIDVAGVPWLEFRPEVFAKPDRDIASRVPRWVAPILRKHAASRPYLERPSGCTRCRTCEKNCPVTAITMTENGPAFDYDKCIRCYCCQETCPPQAIGLKRPWLVRTLVARDKERRA